MNTYPRCLLFLLSLVLLTAACNTDTPENGRSVNADPETGSVIFIHPDGSGAAMWGALRLVTVGPDGMTNWDGMQHMGLYRSHQLDATNSSSHAGATVHAYGTKVPYDSYGSTPNKPVESASGTGKSIMAEARDAGMSVALINSGHICEPGTGVFMASHDSRQATDEITEQLIRSGVDILFAGGERMLLPEGMQGHFGQGERQDGQNLIDTARALGYVVVYSREEMLALPDHTGKALGIFAHNHTFHDAPEEKLAEDGLPLYKPEAPTLAEMTSTALRILNARDQRFLLVIEEEGSDNFANRNNASGTFEALRRADDAIGVAQKYIDRNPETMLITGADSDASGMQVVSIRDSAAFMSPLPPTEANGSPLDGINGPETLPFTSRPDAHGTTMYFGVTWASYKDLAGAVLVRTYGLNAGYLPQHVDNTGIYRMMYLTLFGMEP